MCGTAAATAGGPPTGNCRASTLITGGGVAKSASFLANVSTCSVADMITSFRGPATSAAPLPPSLLARVNPARRAACVRRSWADGCTCIARRATVG